MTTSDTTELDIVCEADALAITRTRKRKPARLFTLLDRGDISPFEMSVLAQLRAGTLPEERVKRALFGVPNGTLIASATDADAVFGPLLRGRTTEAFAVAALNRAGELVEVATLTTGSEAACLIDRGQVLRWALTRAQAVASIILAHNHPSGRPEPSMQDQESTRILRYACDQVGMRLHDHIIVVDRAPWYCSFAERGLL